jgi:hypothetical protein
MALPLQYERPLPRRELDWDVEWGRAWKPHPLNPWFQYQCDVLAV